MTGKSRNGDSVNFRFFNYLMKFVPCLKTINFRFAFLTLVVKSPSYAELGSRLLQTGRYFNISPKKVFIASHDSLSAFSLYTIGRLNFFPTAVARGFEKACVAPGYTITR